MSKRPKCVAELKPWERNPRRITKQRRAGLGASVEAFGDISGIVFNIETGRLVTGHQRVSVLEGFASGDIQWEADWRETESGSELWGWLDAPSGRFRVRGVRWTPEREKAANVAANNPHIGGEFTDDLQPILAEIETENAALFEKLCMDELWDGDHGSQAAPAGEDDVPDAPAEPITKRGDLWMLGRHRLLCGDGTSAEDIARVLDGDKPGVTVVDPPYEIGDAAYVQHIADPSLVFGRAGVAKLIPDDWYRFDRVLIKGMHFRQQSIGVAYRHALIFQVGSVRAVPQDIGLWRDSVVECAMAEQVKLGEKGFGRNARQGKPLDLIMDHLTHWTPPWEMVFDPFVGTGTSIIVAERMGRRACAIEMEPERCDVIVARWGRETGQQARRADS